MHSVFIPQHEKSTGSFPPYKKAVGSSDGPICHLPIRTDPFDSVKSRHD